MQDVLAGLGPGSDLERRYVDAAAARLDAEPFATARRDWTALLTETQGDLSGIEIPARGPLPADRDAGDRLFLAALYYDFLIEGLLDAAERETGVTVSNRDPRENTDLLETPPRVCHATLPEVETAAVTDHVAGEPIRELSVGDLQTLYRRVLPREARLALGQYDTPPGLAALAVDRLDRTTGDRLLDPGCGAGAVLAAGVADTHSRLADRDPGDRLASITDRVVGVDLNPLAVKAAKLAYVCTLLEPAREAAVDRIELPVFLADALGLAGDGSITYRGEALDRRFDGLAGNPPWIPWSRLPERSKARWRDRYVDELGLQPHGGVAARLGHSNDDVSVPYAWVCIHRYLREGGRASFVLKRDATRGPAGSVLRRLRVGERPLALARVDDFAAVEPFPEVGANAALYTFVADAEPAFPVPATVWERRDGVTPDFADAATLRATLATRETELVPLDPDDRTTAWIRTDAERAATGECVHEIRHGLKDDAAAVFGIDRADLDRLDPELVYPYLKSRHVVKYGLVGHDLRLVPARAAGEDNEDWLRREYPRTYDYLDSHRERLESRGSTWFDTGPFYSVFGLGEYTWAPYKVVWCRLGFKPDFAVVSTREDPDLGERPVVPGDHYMFVATDDGETAHFLCALLNSAPYQRTIRDLSTDGKASLSKSLVSELRLPAFPGTELARELAARSRRAHHLVADAAADGKAATRPAALPELASLQAEIDRLAASALTGETRGAD